MNTLAHNSPMSKTIRSDSGSGFQGDRIAPAVILAAQGKLGYLALECPAERAGREVEALGFALPGMEIGA